MDLLAGVVVGVVLLVVLRIALRRALLLTLRRDVAALGRGDYAPLLSGYAQDAVLEFNDGDHRWAGSWVGKDAIERFLAEFVRCGLSGEITDLWFGGWPWSMTILVTFDDHADSPDGARIYDKHTVLKCRTRWGRIVHQEDFYVDTQRMVDLDRRLTALGVLPPT